MSTTTVPARVGVTGRLLGWLRAVPLARMLDAAAIVVAIVVSIAAGAATAAGLFAYARRHDETVLAAATFATLLVGLWALLTCYGWRARLRRGRVPAVAWVLLSVVTAAGVAVCATGEGRGSPVVSAAPVAALAAVSVLLSTVKPTGQDRGHRGPRPERRDRDATADPQQQTSDR